MFYQWKFYIEYMHGLNADSIYGPKPKKKAQLEAFLK